MSVVFIRKKQQGFSQTEKRPCGGTARGWPFTRQEERLQKTPRHQYIDLTLLPS
jgi:hypothetical protein